MSQTPQHIQQQQFQHQITHIPLGGNVQFPGFTVPISTANTVGGIPIGVSPQGTITLPNNITVQSLLQSLQQQNKKQQLVQLTQLQLGQHQLQQNQSFQLHFQPAITNSAATIQQSPQQQILPDSSSQDIGGNNLNLSSQISHAPTNSIIAQNVNTDLKSSKKRQYIKRKGTVNTLITNTENLSNVKDNPIYSVLSPKQTTITALDIDANKKTSVDTLKIAETCTTSKSLVSDNKSAPFKSDILTTKKENFKVEVNLTGVQLKDFDDEQLFNKKNLKRSKKPIKIKDFVKDVLKNDTKDVTKSVKFKLIDSPPNTPKKATKAELSLNILKEKNPQKILELEKELAKCQKQLNIEKNKFIAQKKKLDKLQLELEKSSDQIQLVQIDLACQKTDNNCLVAQNIALKYVFLFLYQFF